MKLLKNLWNKWLPVAQAIGNFMGQVIMTVFYLVILLPLGIFIRLFRDVLNIKKESLSKRRTNFEKWSHPKQSIEEARKQY